MTDIEVPGPDPQFPNRPQHVDFWRMAAAVKVNDHIAESGDMERLFAEVDHRSLMYMAEQRALRAMDKFPEPDLTTMSSVWLDGFMAALRFAESRAEAVFNEPAPVEGNRRQRRRNR